MAAEIEDAAGGTSGRSTGAAGAVADRCVASGAVVLGAAIGCPDRVVCGIDPHHPRVRFIAGHVRVVAARKTTVRHRDGLVVGVARDAQDDICVALDSFEHVVGPPMGSAPSTAMRGLYNADPAVRGVHAP